MLKETIKQMFLPGYRRRIIWDIGMLTWLTIWLAEGLSVGSLTQAAIVVTSIALGCCLEAVAQAVICAAHRARYLRHVR